MRLVKFLSTAISSNSGVSSKRLMGTTCIMAGIIIPLISMFLGTMGQIHETILIYSAQLLTVGCGLLGLTLGEKKVRRRNPSATSNNTK